MGGFISGFIYIQKIVHVVGDVEQTEEKDVKEYIVFRERLNTENSPFSGEYQILILVMKYIIFETVKFAKMQFNTLYIDFPNHNKLFDIILTILTSIAFQFKDKNKRIEWKN